MFAKLFGRKQAKDEGNDGNTPAEEASVNEDPKRPDGDQPENHDEAEENHHDLAMVENLDAGSDFESDPVRKGLFRKFESKVRRKVDGYVDAKAVELLDDATRRAEQFRQETLFAVRENAMQLLDLTEHRIDEKLVQIEKMLEERLQAELRMRLRALVLTLLFVLVMALISIGYVWLKRETGLETTPETQTSAPADEPAEAPAEEPAETPAEEPAETPAEEPEAEPAEPPPPEDQ
jgi:hypothetical protein